MNRESYSDYLRRYDGLMEKLNNPSIAREALKSTQRGIPVEVSAFHYEVTVESLEEDITTLGEISKLTHTVTEDLFNGDSKKT